MFLLCVPKKPTKKTKKKTSSLVRDDYQLLEMPSPDFFRRNFPCHKLPNLLKSVVNDCNMICTKKYSGYCTNLQPPDVARTVKIQRVDVDKINELLSDVKVSNLYPKKIPRERDGWKNHQRCIRPRCLIYLPIQVLQLSITRESNQSNEIEPIYSFICTYYDILPSPWRESARKTQKREQAIRKSDLCVLASMTQWTQIHREALIASEINANPLCFEGRGMPVLLRGIQKQK